MESGFQELAERLNDGGYKNWLKASQCLSLLQGALRPFATSHMSAFHGQLLQRHGPLRVPSEARCRVRGNTLPAPCRTCQAWQAVILSHHRHGTSATINWGNCFPPRWRSDFWEVAKAYMPRGQTEKAAHQCDAAALLNLVNFCDCFHSVDLKCVREVIRCRNELMHSLELSVSDHWMLLYGQSLRKVVQDLSPEGAAVGRQIEKMLSVNLSVCVLDETVYLVAQSAGSDDVDLLPINAHMVSYWEEELLQERLQELLQAASASDGVDAARTQAVLQLRRLQLFLQDNRDLSRRFSAQLHDIGSLLAADQRDEDEEQDLSVEAVSTMKDSLNL